MRAKIRHLKPGEKFTDGKGRTWSYIGPTGDESGSHWAMSPNSNADRWHADVEVEVAEPEQASLLTPEQTRGRPGWTGR